MCRYCHSQKEGQRTLAAQEGGREHVARSDKPGGKVCVDAGTAGDANRQFGELSDRDFAGYSGIAARRNIGVIEH